MRYDDDTLIDALAREYVLGTLQGRARARFDRIRLSSLPAQRAVIEWERRLAPLSASVDPVQPDPSA